MAYDKVVDSTVLNAGLTQIANAIRAKTGTGGTLEFPSGFVSAIEGLSSGIKATAGTFTVAQHTSNYNLAHGLGEVPSLFFFGTDSKDTDFSGSSLYFIGAYGFSHAGCQYNIHVDPDATEDKLYTFLAQDAITTSNNNCALSRATISTITLAHSPDQPILYAGVPYYWIAVGSGVFSE